MSNITTPVTIPEREAARRLGVTNSTLTTWRKRGQLPAGVVVVLDRPPRLDGNQPIGYDVGIIDAVAAGERKLFQ